jgi:hypothetical protein
MDYNLLVSICEKGTGGRFPMDNRYDRKTLSADAFVNV